LISQLPSPHRDKYTSVRVGECFLEASEEALIVRFIDEIAASLETKRAEILDSVLRSTAILIINYQYALRPKQIAMLRMRNVRTWTFEKRLQVAHPQLAYRLGLG
jgi:hypothetical protein